MRDILCTIMQNLGTGIPGNSLALTTQVIRIGKITREIDEELTKISVSETTVEVADVDGSVWAFVQSQLALPNAWAPSTAYTKGVQVTNGGNIYLCTSAGSSAASGGPSGTGGSITDGTCTWSYVSAGAPATQGLLPPYIQIVVGGTVKYTGIMDPSRIVLHEAADLHSIEFGAQDWSIQLANTYLGAPSANPWQPLYRYSVGMEIINDEQLFQCTTAGVSGPLASGGPILGHGLTVNDGTVVWTYVPPGWIRPAPQAAIATYNGTTPSSLNYLIVQKKSGDNDTSIWLQSVNGIFPQDTLATVFSQNGQSGTYTVLSTDPELLCVNVKETVSGLKIGDGVYFDDATNQELVMADAIQTLQQAASPFSVDTSRFVKQALPMPVFGWLPVVDVAQAVWAPHTAYAVGNQVTHGGNIYQCDVAGTSAASGGPTGTNRTTLVTDGSVQWLYMPPTLTNLVAISDIEPSLTGIRVLSGFSCAYHGGPDAGWTPETPVLPLGAPATYLPVQPQYADWTNQISSAPASLMPYTNRTGIPSLGTPGDAWFSILRNRCYHSYNWGALVDNGPTPWYQAPGWMSANPAWDASTPSTWYDPFGSVLNQGWYQSNSLPPVQIFYDYLGMRKIVVASSQSSSQTLTVYPWTGTAWGSPSTYSWPGGHTILSLCNFPGGSAPAGALMALTNVGSLELAVLGASSPVAQVTLHPTVSFAVLVPTLYGPCLVGSQGYGQVTYSGGVLACPYVVLGWLSGNGANGPVTAFWPSTFVAWKSTEAIVMGRLDTTDNGTTSTESYFYRLSLPPNTDFPEKSVLFSEPISAGAPVFAAALLDPTKAGRVVGHWGGQLWQFDYEAPLTIERFTPDGMTALECCEHIGQLFNAIVVPQASGSLAIVSRNISEAPIAITVDVVKTDSALCWPHFYSTVRCTTQDGNAYWDAPSQGGPVGGKLLEVQNHPMLWRVSQCGAMAENLAAWFAATRSSETHQWTYPDPDTAPPWEGLPPFARVTVNGTGPWRVMTTDEAYIEGTCDPVLVED